MQEIVELRVLEEYASMVFSDSEGQKLGSSVRKIKLNTHDPKYGRVGEVDRHLASVGRSFFFGWKIEREYNNQELAAAKCFHLSITATFEPAGEECGTKYDETTACPKCGSGAKQISDLRLDLRKVPKNKDIARSIADEWIVSQRLAEKMIDTGLTGFELRPVRHKARYEDDPVDLAKISIGREIIRLADEAGAPHPSWQFYVWLNRPENRKLAEEARFQHAALLETQAERKKPSLPVWHQLVISQSSAIIIPPTRIGNDPFDDDEKGECRCPLGDLLGLNLLSEISIDAQSYVESDLFCSTKFIGCRRGLLRPSPEILVSPRFRERFMTEGFRGAKFEVAYVV